MVGAAAGAILVVALLMAIIAFSQRPNGSGSTPGSSTSLTPTARPCDFLKAGVASAAGAGGTCGLKLGSQVQAYSFGQSTLPADLTGVGIDRNGAPRGKATVPVGAGFATLSAGSRGGGVGVLSGAQPADLIVIADFTPTSSGDANIGIGARCSATDCVEVYVSPKGKVWVAQRAGGAAPVQKFNSEVQVQVNQLNRLVVAVRGSQLQSWINGSLISSVQVDVNSAGAIVFFDSNQDTTPSTTNLSGLYVFAPG